MTRKELMAIVDNQLPKGQRCVSILYPRFSNNQRENGAHVMGIWTESGDYIMAWFKLTEVNLKIDNIRLAFNLRISQWELKLNKK